VLIVNVPAHVAQLAIGPSCRAPVLGIRLNRYTMVRIIEDPSKKKRTPSNCRLRFRAQNALSEPTTTGVKRFG
jgi:hypothetical protein